MRAINKHSLRYHGRSLWNLFHGSKWVAAGALVFDDEGRLLLIRHRFRRAWEYPVGMSDGAESPRQTAAREVAEEVGLTLDELVFVGVDSFRRRTPNGNLVFTFVGSATAEQIKGMKLDKAESTSRRWVTRDEAVTLIADRLRDRLVQLLAAYDSGRPVYLETVTGVDNPPR